jgi:hypothetical protein
MDSEDCAPVWTYSDHLWPCYESSLNVLAHCVVAQCATITSTSDRPLGSIRSRITCIRAQFKSDYQLLMLNKVMSNVLKGVVSG